MLIYWLLMVSFGQVMQAVVGGNAGTVAEQGFAPGDRIVEAGGTAVEGWRPFYNELILHLGEKEKLPVTVTTASGDTAVRELDTSPWSADLEQLPLDALGISQAVLIGEVVAGSAADQAGLRAQDQVVALNGEPVAGWQSWQETIMASAGETLEITVLRDGATAGTWPETVTEGADLWPYRCGHGRHLSAIRPGWCHLAASERFAEQCEVVGPAGETGHRQTVLDNLGGPYIAQVAGERLYGIAGFLALLAVGITLRVINQLRYPCWMAAGFSLESLK